MKRATLMTCNIGVLMPCRNSFFTHFIPMKMGNFFCKETGKDSAILILNFLEIFSQKNTAPDGFMSTSFFNRPKFLGIAKHKQYTEKT